MPMDIGADFFGVKFRDPKEVFLVQPRHNDLKYARLCQTESHS